MPLQTVGLYKPIDPLDRRIYSNIVPTDVEWLMNGHIVERDVSMWIGSGEVGKGRLACDVAARVTQGWPMPPHDPLDPSIDPDDCPTPGWVIMITPEDDASSTVTHRLRASGADLSKVYDMTRVDRGAATGNTVRNKFSIPQDIGLLKAKIQELGDVRLVIIDPLLAVSTKTIAFNMQARMWVIDPLQELAQEMSVPILLIHHFNKGMTIENMNERFNGSKGLSDALRVVSAIVGDPLHDDVRLLLRLKNNHMQAMDVPRLEYMIMGEGNDVHVRYKMPLPQLTQSNAERLQAHILAMLIEAERPMSEQELVTYTRLSGGIVRQLLTDAADKGMAMRKRRAWVAAPQLMPTPEAHSDTEELTPIELGI